LGWRRAAIAFFLHRCKVVGLGFGRGWTVHWPGMKAPAWPMPTGPASSPTGSDLSLRWVTQSDVTKNTYDE
jgi:hypothetical protein